MWYLCYSRVTRSQAHKMRPLNWQMHSFPCQPRKRIRNGSHLHGTDYIHFPFAPGRGYSPVFCSNIIYGGLDHLIIPQNIALIRSIDDLMLISLYEQEAAHTQEALVSHMCSGRERSTLRRFRKLLFPGLTPIAKMMLDYNVLDTAPLDFRNNATSCIITIIYHCFESPS